MKNGRHLDLFVLIDALGWEYIKDREFLDDLLPYRRPLHTVLGYSSGAIPAILSGLTPAQNGHWNLYYYDPTGSPFRWLRHFNFLPSPLLDNRFTAKLLKEIGKRVLGLGPLFECFVKPSLLRWFNWVEKRNIYAPGGIGGAASIFDELKRLRVPYRAYSYHGGVTDKEILDLARRDLESGPGVFFFLYLSQMDHFLHTHCAEPAKVGDRMRWYEEELRRLFAAARSISPNASLTVFSDHGMTPVLQHFNLVFAIEALGFRMPEDYLAVYDSTMARFWFFSEAARSAVSAHLNTTSCGRILQDAELRALGILFEDRRYGELVFLLHPGWLLADSNFSGASWLPAGMHGYHPDDPNSDAIFLSSQAPGSEVETIRDVHQCMRQAAFTK